MPRRVQAAFMILYPWTEHPEKRFQSCVNYAYDGSCRGGCGELTFQRQLIGVQFQLEPAGAKVLWLFESLRVD